MYKYLKDQNILLPLIITLIAILFVGIVALISYLPNGTVSDINACKSFYGEEWAKQAYENNCLNKKGETRPLPVIN